MPTPYFTHDLVADSARLRSRVFIDLSVPRSVAADVEQVLGVVVYNIDSIQNKASEALARRLTAVPQVRAIVADGLASLADWNRDLQVSPTIHKLKSTLEEMRQQEVSRFQKKLSPTEAAWMEEVTKSLTRKFLKLPVVQLKAACQRGEADQFVAVLNELFDLQEAQPQV
jgi:glutamyl-tRNA reductase